MSKSTVNLHEMAKHSDGKTVLLKTNYKDPVKRYEMAERIIWSKLDKWKKQVIISCKLKGNIDDRILNEYASAIALLAEGSTDISQAETLSPVPAYTLESEKASDKAQSLQD